MGEERLGELLLHHAQHLAGGKAQGEVRGRGQREDRGCGPGDARLAGQESVGREGRVRGEAEGVGRSREPDYDEGLPSCRRWWDARGRHAWRWVRWRGTWWCRWPDSRGGRLDVSVEGFVRKGMRSAHGGLS